MQLVNGLVSDPHVQIAVFRLRREFTRRRFPAGPVFRKPVFISLRIAVQQRCRSPGKTVQSVFLAMKSLSDAHGFISGLSECLRQCDYVRIPLPYPGAKLRDPGFFRAQACEQRCPGRTAECLLAICTAIHGGYGRKRVCIRCHRDAVTVTPKRRTQVIDHDEKHVLPRCSLTAAAGSHCEGGTYDKFSVHTILIYCIRTGSWTASRSRSRIPDR